MGKMASRLQFSILGRKLFLKILCLLLEALNFFRVSLVHSCQLVNHLLLLRLELLLILLFLLQELVHKLVSVLTHLGDGVVFGNYFIAKHACIVLFKLHLLGGLVKLLLQFLFLALSGKLRAL